MNRTIIVDNDLKVEVDFLLQFFTPGLFDGCSSQEEMNMRTKAVAELIREKNKLDEFHVLESSLTSKDENVILCFMGLTCNKTFKISDGFSSRMNIVWSQQNYAFPIEKDILDKLKAFPFRELSLDERNPFLNS